MEHEREVEIVVESADSPPMGEVEQLHTPIVMGDVQQVGMGAQLGSVPPVVSGLMTPPPLPFPGDEQLIVELQKRRELLAARVQTIEGLINFVQSEGDLAMRVGKIEHFLGVIGARL